MPDQRLFSVLRIFRHLLPGYLPVLVISWLAVMSLAGLRAAGADIMSVRIEKLMPRVFRFDVTVLHEGESHDHYVDRWEILTKQGEIIDVRELVHPHIDEQPFTRSLSHVTIPIGVRDVIVRAHDTVHGYAGQVETVHLDIESRNDAIE